MDTALKDFACAGFETTLSQSSLYLFVKVIENNDTA
jgi:hypothetical protein